MANSDSFINEVTEEVRRDRLYAMFRRYGWIAVLLILLLVAGAAWNEWRKAQARAEAEARGDALLAALEAGDPAAQGAALEALRTGGPAEPVIALLDAAQAASTDGPAVGIERLNAMAADPATPQLYRDLATLKAAMTGAGLTPPDARIAALEPLSAPGGAFRALALEQIALGARTDRAGPCGGRTERRGHRRPDGPHRRCGCRGGAAAARRAAAPCPRRPARRHVRSSECRWGARPTVREEPSPCR
ncbi:MAG: hypothetical protein MUF63_17990 [Rhodobacteraceae bacterium]|nr:hypothetical protein [Paracoccaceae bacterium]